MNNFYGDGANQRRLEAMGGQEEPSSDHSLEHIIEGAIEWTVIFIFLSWFIRKMFHRPIAGLIFIGSSYGLIWVGNTNWAVAAPSTPWQMYVLLGTGLIAFFRIVMRAS